MPTTRRALLRLSGTQAPVAIEAFCLARCFIHCQSCADACPTQAIRFIPRLGAPPQPLLEAARCTGCGDCIAACPADAIVRQQESARV